MTDKTLSQSGGGAARFLMATVMLWLMWLVLTWSLDPQEMGVGAGVAALTALFTSQSPSMGARVLFNPVRLIRAVLYVPFLFVEIVRANVDVAKRVISPKLDINPGLVRVKTTLKSPVARLILANSITLTPGTLTVDMEGEDLFIHWIDVTSDDIDGASRAIVAGFEKKLEKIFG